MRTVVETIVTLVAIALPSLALLELALRGQQPSIPRARAKEHR